MLTLDKTDVRVRKTERNNVRGTYESHAFRMGVYLKGR